MADLISMLAAASGIGAEEADPNFNQTVLLLHGDGTNGAQNNTFLDSSTNNFTITRNGNTTQGTFSPFSLAAGEWSNYFDGSGDYLSGPTDNAISTFTGDFTIEMWANFSSIAASSGLMQCLQAGPPELGWQFYWRQANTSFRLYSSALGSFDFSYTPTVGSWIHIALSRSGTSLRCFVNGTQVGTTQTMSGTVTRSTVNSLQIGGGSYGITSINGYLSNVRLVNGTAVYTSAFTPPTSPLTAITNTSLLTCQSNRFVDNSTNAFAITRNGDVRVTPFSPFAPTAAYSAGTNGGSGYFDGSGDYLQTTSTQIIPASTTYTIEAWVYLTGSYADYREIVCQGTSGNAGRIILFVDITSGELRVQFGSTGSASGVTIVPNQWYYVAFRNNGGSYNLYVNGVSVASGTNTTTPQNTSLTIGAFSSGAEYWQGYISNVRISNTARTITLPTAPFSSDANTRLLTNFTNAGIIDNTGKNVLETVGNAQIDTTTKKFGTGSLEFDGTGDWLLMPNTPDQQLGTGNFTIEFWVYLASGDTGSARGLVAKGGASTGWLVSLDSSQKVVFTYTTSTITSSGAITTNAWNHIAVVRSGTGSNQTKIYIGGTNDGTGTVSTDFNQTESMYVGANRTGGDPMKGFIDDLRITKGVARYTANFTPPTAAFPNE